MQVVELQRGRALQQDRGQTDVPINLQDVNLLKVGVTVSEHMSLFPIDHNPVGMSLTANGQLKRERKPVTHFDKWHEITYCIIYCIVND